MRNVGSNTIYIYIYMICTALFNELLQYGLCVLSQRFVDVCVKMIIKEKKT